MRYPNMKKALFLDRDGVVNTDREYIYKREDFQFIDGIFDLCRYFQERGYLLFIVTNQSGIARGYYSETDFATLAEWMKERFLEYDITITDIHYCPHHPTKGVGAYRLDCKCRKPKPGMILDLANKYDVDLQNSLLIGDKPSDIQAADEAKIGRNYLLSSSYHNEESFATLRELLESIQSEH